MTTVSVAKREGLSLFFTRCFDHVSQAARFAESWLPMHVAIVTESGQSMSLWEFRQANRDPGDEGELCLRDDADPPADPCPFCGAPEAVMLADDELLHACEVCDRAWYIDSDGNVLPADRCPACESPDVAVDEQGAKVCAACGHRFFFDGLTYVDPATAEGGAA